MLEDAFRIEEPLPDPLPADPFPILEGWFNDAVQRADTPNPNAMTLATVDADGVPSARIVLCKVIEPTPGCVVFYTNSRSRKGRAMAADPRVAVVFHWDTQERQVRVEGVVTRTSDAESDAYFASRRWESRLGAWASAQSEPIESRDALLEKVGEAFVKLGLSIDKPDESAIPRPPHWGGYRLWARSVELWMGGVGRIHDRARWTRDLTPAGDGFTPGAWSATRLQP